MLLPSVASRGSTRRRRRSCCSNSAEHFRRLQHPRPLHKSRQLPGKLRTLVEAQHTHEFALTHNAAKLARSCTVGFLRCRQGDVLHTLAASGEFHRLRPAGRAQSTYHVLDVPHRHGVLRKTGRQALGNHGVLRSIARPRQGCCLVSYVVLTRVTVFLLLSVAMHGALGTVISTVQLYHPFFSNDKSAHWRSGRRPSSRPR